MSYVLFTPVGGHDPIARFHDGAVLHICRVYRPEKVYLYLSHEMLERSRQDDRYCLSLVKLQQQLGCKMEIHQIERDELTQVQLFDTFYTDFDQLLREIHNENPGSTAARTGYCGFHPGEYNEYAPCGGMPFTA